jgi:hypothetical protein
MSTPTIPKVDRCPPEAKIGYQNTQNQNQKNNMVERRIEPHLHEKVTASKCLSLFSPLPKRPKLPLYPLHSPADLSPSLPHGNNPTS